MTLYPTNAGNMGAPSFGDRPASMINRERMEAIGDAGSTADLVERQIHCLAYTLMLCVPAAKIGEILAGVEQAIYESVSDAGALLSIIGAESAKTKGP